jgi:nucleoside-diphosphate-sugar epimerase
VVESFSFGARCTPDVRTWAICSPATLLNYHRVPRGDFVVLNFGNQAHAIPLTSKHVAYQFLRAAIAVISRHVYQGTRRNVDYLRAPHASQRRKDGSNFIVQALLGRDSAIFGDGRQTRSSDDVIGPVNFGNPQEFTIADLASTVIKLTGSRSHIAYRPTPQDDPRQRRPDISIANETLAWAPRTSFPMGSCARSNITKDCSRRRHSSLHNP